MYSLLCEYAERFGKDFPISAVMKTSNENGVIQILQKCLNTDTPYVAKGEDTATDTNSGRKNGKKK